MNVDINDESFFEANKLLILRGLPGSSKSTLATLIAKKYYFRHFEADMYFIKDGVYTFDAAKISLAHKWCRESTEKAIKDGKSVVVSNTFTQLWELKSYTDIANHNKVPFKVIKCCGKFKNVHNVPVESLDKMAKRWEDFNEELEYHPSN